MEYTVTIADADNWGIAAAREAHNEGRPATVPNPDDPEGPEIPNPLIIETDADYVQFVMARANDSYRVQYPDKEPQ